MEKSYTILICEDEEFVARSYIRKLELEGFTVIHTKNGREALAQIRSAPPDLLLLDLMMPIMSGFEVLTELKKEEGKKIRELPIIVTSNLGQQSDIDEAMELGATDFLIKSNISLKDLAEKVNKHLPK